MSDKKERPTNKNLKPFKKGQSGNPSGKVKGTKNSITILREVLIAEMTEEERKEAGKDFDPRVWMFKKYVDVAKNDEARDSDKLTAVDKMWDRAEGKAIARVEQTTEDVTPPTKIELTAPDDDNSET